MLSARDRACALLEGTDVAGGEVWGYAGRTLSGAVTTPDGPAWPRLVSEPEGKAGGRLWEGPEEAERSVPPAVPRPRLLKVRDWSAENESARSSPTSWALPPADSGS